MTDLCKCDWKEKIKAIWERLQTTIYGIRLNGTRLNPDGQGIIDINTDNLIELDTQVRNNDLVVKNRAIKAYVDTGDATNATAIANLSNDTTATISQLNTTLSNAITTGDATNSARIENVNTNLSNRITTLTAQTESDLSELDERIDDLETTTGDAITSADINTTASTVTITHKHLNTTVDTDSMPVASITQSGVINASDYQAFVQMQEDIDDLKGAQITYSVAFNTSTPTQEQITQTFTSTYPTVSLIAGIKVADYMQNLAYQYDGTIWVSQQFSGSIPIASSTVIGGVKSSNTNGQIAVNIDGTMALNGYDFINDRLDDIDGTGGSIEQLESEIDALQTSVTGHGTRLNTAEDNIQMLDSDIEDLSNDITTIDGQISTINSSVLGLQTSKQNTLSSAQLNAVNSGIDSTKVGQIATNQNNITTLNGQVEAINTAVSGMQTTISGLQTTIAGKENTLNADQKRKITISTADPTGGSNGDIWLKYGA